MTKNASVQQAVWHRQAADSTVGHRSEIRKVKESVQQAVWHRQAADSTVGHRSEIRKVKEKQ